MLIKDVVVNNLQYLMFHYWWLFLVISFEWHINVLQVEYGF